VIEEVDKRGEGDLDREGPRLPLTLRTTGGEAGETAVDRAGDSVVVGGNRGGETVGMRILCLPPLPPDME
tara:strand:- start:694 stop:903 length:210 start_codon:yes stop_codon:yes gene_type:complete